MSPDIHLKRVMTVLLNGNMWRFPSTARPSRSWKPCFFQNTLETYPIPDPIPTWGYIMSCPSWPECSSFCPWVLSPCFNKITFLHQRHLQEFFLSCWLWTTPWTPHHPKTSSIPNVPLTKLSCFWNLCIWKSPNLNYNEVTLNIISIYNGYLVFHFDKNQKKSITWLILLLFCSLQYQSI